MVFCLQNGMSVWGFVTENKFNYVTTWLPLISAWDVYQKGNVVQSWKERVHYEGETKKWISFLTI